jgi:NAD-dependent deacetylase
MDKIVILTGAGISAESGLGTFRDAGGLWETHPIEDVATPEGFARNPDLVHAFYNARRAQARIAKPNAAHIALAQLEHLMQGNLTLITQNVDGLHEAAGAQQVIHMHGILDGALCASCNARWTAPLEMNTALPCPACNQPSARPDIVWFGEIPYQMDLIMERIANADLFVAIGTSGQVYPAAGFVQFADENGADTLELNLAPDPGLSAFAETRIGPATQTVPRWVQDLRAALP